MSMLHASIDLKPIVKERFYAVRGHHNYCTYNYIKREDFMQGSWMYISLRTHLGSDIVDGLQL